MSMIEQYLWRAMSSHIKSWLGNGVVSITVFALRSRASITVRSLSSFEILGMERSGTAFLPCTRSHHPALRYRSVFSRKRGNSAAAHFGGRDEYCTSGLMSGIGWFTSRKGGNSGGGGPYISE